MSACVGSLRWQSKVVFIDFGELVLLTVLLVLLLSCFCFLHYHQDIFFVAVFLQQLVYSLVLEGALTHISPFLQQKFDDAVVEVLLSLPHLHPH